MNELCSLFPCAASDSLKLDKAQRNALNRRVVTASWTMAGLAVLADWIGSNHEAFPFHSEPMELSTYFQDFALPRAHAAVARAGIAPAAPAKNAVWETLFPGLAEKPPTSLQQWAAECVSPEGPQLHIFEDLTGAGKTEAALLCVHQLMRAGLAEGAYFALPTTAMASSMYARLRTAYVRLYNPGGGRPSLVLAHGATRLDPAFRESIDIPPVHAKERIAGPAEYLSQDPYRGESTEAFCAAWLADNRKKSLLAHVGVGTIDQALLAVLPVRHQSLRLLGLARNVLVVDEVHAYDTYQNRLLETLVRFHAAAGGSIVLMSATLPIAIRNKFVAAFCDGAGMTPPSVTPEDVAYPLAYRVLPNQIETPARKLVAARSRDVQVQMIHDEGNVVSILRQTVQDGACACWMRNTVNDALEAYDCLLTAGFAPDRVILFHARFALGDRLAIERDVLERFGKASTPETRAGRVVIATQVAEASLDLDFDVLVSDLAPIDRLIQRVGRCCRHPWRPRPDGYGEPRLYVLGPEPTANAKATWYSAMFRSAAHVYRAHGELWRTARVLSARGRISLPADARELVETVFADSADDTPEELTARDIKAEGEEAADKALAGWRALTLEEGYAEGGWVDDEERIPTRLGESVRFRLTRLVKGAPRPWLEDADELQAWRMSETSLRPDQLWRASAETIPDADAIRAAMPDGDRGGRWTEPLLLTEEAAGGWRGSGENGAGERRIVAYDRVRGLRIIKE